MSEEGKDSKPKKKSSYKSKKKFKREFLPPVDLKTDPDYPVNFPDLIVAGHKVTPREAAIFYEYHTCHNPKLVCEKFGITPQGLWDFTNREWWKKWSLDQIKEWLDVSRNHFLSTGEKLVLKVNEVLDNPSAAPSGYPMALTKLLELFLRASPEGLRPTLVSKFEHEFETKRTNTLDVKINITSDTVKKLSPEQIDEWNITGVIPQELTEIKGYDADKKNAVEIEFEEVEEEGNEDE